MRRPRKPQKVKPFTFSADIGEVVTGPELAARARRAEDLGYNALVVADHLPGRLSPIVAMASVAAATTALRVSAFVMNNDLRHPAVIAADLAQHRRAVRRSARCGDRRRLEPTGVR